MLCHKYSVDSSVQMYIAALYAVQGLGFGSSAASPPVVDKSQKSAGWEAPYELSDKFEQAPEITTSKRSRSSHHHKHTPEKRHRAHGSSSPGRSSHQDHDRTAHHRQSGKEQPTRHHSSREVREEHHQPSSQSRKRRSVSPDDRHHRQNHRSSSQPESKRDSSRHTSRREQSSHTQHERHGHHRSSDLHHRQHHTSRSRSGAATSSGIAPKAPDYAKLIVGYKYMSDASRLKAVTAYKLRKTSAKVQPRP